MKEGKWQNENDGEEAVEPVAHCKFIGICWGRTAKKMRATREAPLQNPEAALRFLAASIRAVYYDGKMGKEAAQNADHSQPNPPPPRLIPVWPTIVN